MLGFARFGPGLSGALAWGAEPVSLARDVFRPANKGGKTLLVWPERNGELTRAFKNQGTTGVADPL